MRGEIRNGRVSSADPKTHTAKVQFTEVDGFITRDLPILVTNRGDYNLPVKDTLVVCFIPDDVVGKGFIFGTIYSESDAPPTDDKARRVLAGDDTRLGSADAEDKVALAPATKAEIQKAVDYAEGIANAIIAGVPVPQDGGANLKATIVAALPVKPVLSAPAAELVSAK